MLVNVRSLLFGSKIMKLWSLPRFSGQAVEYCEHVKYLGVYLLTCNYVKFDVLDWAVFYVPANTV